VRQESDRINRAVPPNNHYVRLNLAAFRPNARDNNRNREGMDSMVRGGKKHVSLRAFVAAALIVVISAGPSLAVDAKQKMATCKFGADGQKLQGAARDAFLKKCMANRDDPRGPATAGAAPKQ
jgi:hypothetical protein